MMGTTHVSTNIPVSPPPGDDEIDLRKVAAALGRHKFLIASFTVAAALLVASMLNPQASLGRQL